MKWIKDSLLADATIPVVLVDEEERILEANQAFRNLAAQEDGEDQSGRLLRAYVRLDRSAQGDVLSDDRISFSRCTVPREGGEGSHPSALIRIPLRTVEGKRSALLLLARQEWFVPSPEDLHVARLASLGKLLAGIIHEISSPLSVINGCAQLLDASDNLPEDMVETVKRIRSEAGRTSDIVRRVLSFARKNRDVDERFTLQEVLEEATVLKQYALKNKNIRLQISTTPARPLVVEGFRSRLIQVLLNLINNAEQAIIGMGGEGAITLRLEAEDGMATVEIRDSGPGIPPDKQDRIFDAFFTTKEREQGTGMGLYLARKIVRDHGGDLILASGKAGETTFRFTLPLKGEGGREQKTASISG